MASCEEKTEVTPPSVLLSEQQMTEVMTDVQILENAINYRRGKNIKVNNLKSRGFDAVFSHYGITDSIFLENLDYYNSNPEKMKTIMDSVNAFFVREKNKKPWIVCQQKRIHNNPRSICNVSFIEFVINVLELHNDIYFAFTA